MNEKQELIKKSLQNLDSMKDSDIDYSDSAEVNSAAIKKMKPFLSHDNKQQISIRIDQDVIDYFKGMGKGYQSRINSVLKEYVNHVKHA